MNVLVRVLVFFVSFVPHCITCSGDADDFSAPVSGPLMPPFEGKERANILVFYSLNETLKLLQHPLYNDVPGVQDLLKDFHRLCEPKPADLAYKEAMQKNTTAYRKPFIVIEGTHFTTKMIVAKKLSDRIGAVLIRHPPQCIAKYSKVFIDQMIVKKAYYSLCLYVMASNASLYLYNASVVIPGFWHDQASYAIGRTYNNIPEMPPVNDDIYQWPEDLLRPDIAFFINSPEPRRPKPLPGAEVKARQITAFRRMTNPTMFEIEGVFHHDQIRYEMELQLKKEYKDNYESIVTPSRIVERRFEFRSRMNATMGTKPSTVSTTRRKRKKKKKDEEDNKKKKKKKRKKKKKDSDSDDD